MQIVQFVQYVCVADPYSPYRHIWRYSKPYSIIGIEIEVICCWSDFGYFAHEGWKKKIYVLLGKFMRFSINDNFLFLGFSLGVGVSPGLWPKFPMYSCVNDLLQSWKVLELVVYISNLRCKFLIINPSSQVFDIMCKRQSFILSHWISSICMYIEVYMCGIVQHWMNTMVCISGQVVCTRK